MEYQSNELREIVDGFRILKYEVTVDAFDPSGDHVLARDDGRGGRLRD
jgi:hypothetical protein